MAFISQGWPNFGALLQIWGNCKFQIWGNAPNLGQKPIFNLEIEWENMLSASHNYSWTFPKPSSLFLCASLATTIKRHGNITKKHVSDNKNFSKYGKLTQIWSNFFDDDTLTQIWGNSPVIGRLHHYESMNKILLELNKQILDLILTSLVQAHP